MSQKKPLEDITQRLRTESGNAFRDAVADAFTFLDFQVDIIPETQGESDLVAKAYLPQKPYFVIIECTAVREGESVGYHKLGQIRGNAPKYFLKYGKELPTYYKVIAGRPVFSDDTKKHALDDVALLTYVVLAKLIEAYSIFQFSQDELKLIFETRGEVREERLNELVTPYQKELTACALVFMCLLEEPTGSPDRRRTDGLVFQNLIGRVAALRWFLDIKDVTESDVVSAYIELSSPLRRIILSSDQKLTLTSIPFDVVIEKMGRQGATFREILLDIQARLKFKRSATSVAEKKQIVLTPAPVERKPRKITLEVQQSEK